MLTGLITIYYASVWVANERAGGGRAGEWAQLGGKWGAAALGCLAGTWNCCVVRRALTSTLRSREETSLGLWRLLDVQVE